MLADRGCQQGRCRRRPTREKRACDPPARFRLACLAIESAVLVALGRGPIRRAVALSYGPAPLSLPGPAESHRVRSLRGPYGPRSKKFALTSHSPPELQRNLWNQEEVRVAYRRARYGRTTAARTRQKEFLQKSLAAIRWSKKLHA